MRRSLTRSERLRAANDIRRLFRAGRRIEAGGLKLLLERNGTPANRMAVVVARGCGGAVRRNREKRLTREAYRTLKERVSPGHDLVFLVARFGCTFAERRSAMGQVLNRAGFRDHAR